MICVGGGDEGWSIQRVRVELFLGVGEVIGYGDFGQVVIIERAP